MIRRLLARLIPGRPARQPRIYSAGDHPVRREQVPRSARTVITRPLGFALLYVAIVAGLFVAMDRLPTGFLPLEDQGQTIVQFTLPVGATQSRTKASRAG